MRIVVLIKYVPQVDSDLRFADDHTVLREPASGTLNELDEHAIETALQLADAPWSAPSEVIAISMAPSPGDFALRKAFQFGVDRGVRITDDALAGSDTFGTTSVLAAAVRKLGEERPVDLVVAGMASSDAAGAVVPALLAYDLGWPGLSFADAVRVSDAGGAEPVVEAEQSAGLAVAPLPTPSSASVETASGLSAQPSSVTETTPPSVEPVSPTAQAPSIASPLESELSMVSAQSANETTSPSVATTITITRNIDDAVETLSAPLPAVLSVTDSANTVRTPNFKLIMAARKKPIETWTLADLDVDAGTIAASAARTVVVKTERVPDKPTPPSIIDDGAGSGAKALVDFLVAKELV